MFFLICLRTSIPLRSGSEMSSSTTSQGITDGLDGLRAGVRFAATDMSSVSESIFSSHAALWHGRR